MSRGLKATAAAEKEPRAGAEDGDAIYQRGIRRKGEGDFVLRRRQGCLCVGACPGAGVARGGTDYYNVILPCILRCLKRHAIEAC